MGRIGERALPELLRGRVRRSWGQRFCGAGNLRGHLRSPQPSLSPWYSAAEEDPWSLALGAGACEEAWDADWERDCGSAPVGRYYFDVRDGRLDSQRTIVSDGRVSRGPAGRRGGAAARPWGATSSPPAPPARASARCRRSVRGPVALPPNTGALGRVGDQPRAAASSQVHGAPEAGLLQPPLPRLLLQQRPGEGGQAAGKEGLWRREVGPRASASPSPTRAAAGPPTASSPSASATKPVSPLPHSWVSHLNFAHTQLVTIDWAQIG